MTTSRQGSNPSPISVAPISPWPDSKNSSDPMSPGNSAKSMKTISGAAMQSKARLSIVSTRATELALRSRLTIRAASPIPIGSPSQAGNHGYSLTAPSLRISNSVCQETATSPMTAAAVATAFTAPSRSFSVPPRDLLHSAAASSASSA